MIMPILPGLDEALAQVFQEAPRRLHGKEIGLSFITLVPSHRVSNLLALADKSPDVISARAACRRAKMPARGINPREVAGKLIARLVDLRPRNYYFRGLSSRVLRAIEECNAMDSTTRTGRNSIKMRGANRHALIRCLFIARRLCRDALNSVVLR